MSKGQAEAKRNCNVISMHNSNAPKYNVILTLSKDVATSNK